MNERTIQWIDKTERMPEAEDADAQGCVLVWDKNNGAMVAGYRNPLGLGRSSVTHWARLPERPEVGDEHDREDPGDRAGGN